MILSSYRHQLLQFGVCKTEYLPDEGDPKLSISHHWPGVSCSPSPQGLHQPKIMINNKNLYVIGIVSRKGIYCIHYKISSTRNTNGILALKCVGNSVHIFTTDTPILSA